MDEQEWNRILCGLSERNFEKSVDDFLELKNSGVDVPVELLRYYKASRSWRGRSRCVYFAVPYARKSEAAVRLGVMALQDKSQHARFRACSLLAFALREDTLESLRQLLSHKEPLTVADAYAAIDAIEHKNHHLFRDRSHSGNVEWIVDEE